MAADVTPANISNLRSSFMQRTDSNAAVETGHNPAHSDVVQFGERKLRSDETPTTSTGNPVRTDSTTEQNRSSNSGSTLRTDNPVVTGATTEALGGTPAQSQQVSLFPLDMGQPGAGLVGGEADTNANQANTSTAATTATPIAPANAAGAGSASQPGGSGGNLFSAVAGNGGPGGPELPGTGSGGPGAPGGPGGPEGPTPGPGQPGGMSQTEYWTRQKAIEDDANQARTIYMQIAADRQKAMVKMFEILQSTRMDLYATMQSLMVNRCKAVETSCASFSGYMRM